VVDCIFGVLYLSNSGDSADTFLGINFLLAALLTVLTWQDLRKRNWTWQAPLVGVSYLFAPLVGLILYALASNRPQGGPAPLTR
jgi:phosphoglycerol transferase MdoB-like AlkP superfamily enzyme